MLNSVLHEWGPSFLGRWTHFRRRATSTLPLAPMQPVLQVVIERVIGRRPALVDRLEGKTNCVFLIDPVNLPFAFLLRIDPDNPMLRACRRHPEPDHDARIAASVLTLMALADGEVDGDALFFTRDLIVEGDTEAVVCLRNAMDDQEVSILDEVADCFGTPGSYLLDKLREVGEGSRERLESS